MTPLGYIALLGWPLVVTILFAILPHRRAATIAVVVAWLYLPPATLPIAGLPDYSKTTAASLGMLMGTLLFAPDRLLRSRPRWFDLPMLAWCLCPFATSLSNDLGPYDGLSEVLNQVLAWGLPYLLGRLYFSTPDDLRYFAVAVVIGGLSYVPLCLYEIRMSPQIMVNLYGIGRWTGMRFGGYRPTVFFLTGLELGIWMTCAALAAWWLWRCGVLRRLGGYPFGPVLLILLATTVLCRSTGALVLLIAGVTTLRLSVRYRTPLFLAALLLGWPIYLGLRIPEVWSGRQAVDLAEAIVGPERAESLAYRFKCERLLADHALERPLLGWGAWNRNLLFFDEEKTKPVPPDGMWILVLGMRGFVGLTLFYLVFITPAARFARLFPASAWGDPRLAAASLAAAFMGVYLFDCLLNAFVNIIYITLAGGLSGLDPRQLRAIGGPAGGAAAPGRRAPGPAPHGRATAASGRALLADRCLALGRSSRRDGRPAEAEAAWEQALDLLAALIEADPGAAGPRRRWCDCANDLAWLRANHPDPSRRDPAAAAALARRAVDEAPDVAAYWNTLGAARYRAGDAAAAIAALERSRALSGGTAFDEVFLAMARARSGDPEGARQALALAMLRAERDHPGHPELAALCDEAHALIAGDAPVTAGIG